MHACKVNQPVAGLLSGRHRDLMSARLLTFISGVSSRRSTPDSGPATASRYLLAHRLLD